MVKVETRAPAKRTAAMPSDSKDLSSSDKEKEHPSSYQENQPQQAFPGKSTACSCLCHCGNVSQVGLPRPASHRLSSAGRSKLPIS
ncbi:hypothetical protein H920_06593 [Fukomys damarensis]|uniref:Uncharacterized protein n=1 Tax=Fukomys damarensis TaxID=885580 RepID=A0A091DIR0_FUKDA|nr:hypothetical protein H920_06593 [Fukomys damarensis]